MKRLILIIVLLVSCNSQSPNAVFVNDMPVTLFAWYDTPSWQFDLWEVSGSEIYGAAFGYGCKIESDGAGVGGIAVNCKVTAHSGGMWGNEYDIWDKPAFNGEPFGYIRTQPLGIWGHNEVKGRTNGDGRCIFFIGLGDPETGFKNPTGNYLWPQDADEMVASIVQAEFIIPKHSGGVSSEGYMNFMRAQHMDFFEPLGGVLGNSSSHLGSLSASYETGNDEVTMFPISMDDIKTRGLSVERPASYKIPVPEGSLDGSLDVNGESGWFYLFGEWWQLKYDYTNYRWYWDISPSRMIPLWLGDENDPNDAMFLVSFADVFAFVCKIYNVEIWDDIKIGSTHTVFLVSKTADGQRVGDVPFRMFVDAKYSRSKEVWLVSDWVVPMENRDEQGVYIDYWGCPVFAMYVPNGGYFEVEIDGFYGDFNFDGFVDFRDYNLFAKHWLQGLENVNYDLYLDATQDGRTTIEDLEVFTGNWLGTRPGRLK